MILRGFSHHLWADDSHTQISPDMQTFISTCLLTISAWVTNRHLKGCIQPYSPAVFPCSINWQFHPSNWLDPKPCSHPWLISFIPPVYSISKSFEFYLQKISWVRWVFFFFFFTTSTATTLKQVNIISYLDSYSSFLSGLPSSGVLALPLPLFSGCFQHYWHLDPIKTEIRS